MHPENLNSSEQTRYQRHLLLPEFGLAGQEKLKATKVLVVGSGGLGCPVLLYLAAAGIGTLGIVDFDTVDESNLQRQILYTTADIGKPKAERAKERIGALNPFIKVQAYVTQLAAANARELVREYDIVVEGSDNFTTRYLVNDACVLEGIPLVYGSIYRFEGQVSVFNVLQPDGSRSPNYRDLFPVPGQALNCAEAGVLGILPGIVGMMQANEVLKLAAGIGEPLVSKLWLFDALTTESRIVKYRHNPKVGPITELKIEAGLDCIVEPEKDKKMKEVTVQELKQLIDSKADFQLIDVREPHEYEIANLGAELIPLGQILNQSDKISEDKQVVIHCRSGARSGNAVAALEQQFGFTNLYNLKGGILAWSDEIDPSVPKY